MEKVGTLEWFKERALNSLTFNTEKNYWDYSDSLLLYAPGAEEEYEETQQDGTDYSSIVTKEEHSYIKEIAPKIIQKLPNEFLYIDLGPGTEHKEKYFFDEIKKQGKQITYIPVDINQPMLDSAKAYAEKEGFKTKKILSSFEDLPHYLDNIKGFRFVSVGLTFINYKLNNITNLLKLTMSSNGAAFANTQIRERVDMEKVKALYSKDGIDDAVDKKMELLGFSHENYTIQTNDRVEVWVTIKNIPEKIQERGAKEGDKFLVLRSIRYSQEELKQIEKLLPVTFFDTGSSFVGMLLTSTPES